MYLNQVETTRSPCDCGQVDNGLARGHCSRQVHALEPKAFHCLEQSHVLLAASASVRQHVEDRVQRHAKAERGSPDGRTAAGWQM